MPNSNPNLASGVNPMTPPTAFTLGMRAAGFTMTPANLYQMMGYASGSTQPLPPPIFSAYQNGGVPAPFAPSSFAPAPAPAQPAATSRNHTKVVCKLECRYCRTPVCNRGMKAILLADAGVELFSTDFPPPTVGMIGEDYTTEKCHCRIRDVACLTCGNSLGYHVTQPCKSCLGACNNGHFWMFNMEGVQYSERMDAMGDKLLMWSLLPTPDKDPDNQLVNEEAMCR
ncbi:Protein fam72b [Allomyces arbusculus]|nr:Protein fam72b [Allomyces arbusculus]